MKIVIASDSYKHCLTSREAGLWLQKGIHSGLPGAEIRVVPVADGGEGTMTALVDATGGKTFSTPVRGPLGDIVEAEFGLLGDGTTGVVEMASASGIELIPDNKRNPLKASTYGTGELIRKALDAGCRRLIIGLGGSATNDGGTGMLAALGVRFLDGSGNAIQEGGGGLDAISEIDVEGLDQRIFECDIIVASDVNNPLTGKNGASFVYGPQKGADADTARQLDENLERYAKITARLLGADHSESPGAGAAGGLGFGILAFLKGSMRNGFDVVREVTGLEKVIEDSDLIITGEGRLDFQTQYGKTPYGVAQIAGKYGKPVIAVGGSLGKGYEVLYNKGFTSIISIADRPMTLEESLSEAPQLLKAAGRAIAGMIDFLCS